MSIPTSLIVVILVAAWLAVLVPIFAKRREPVPETEMDGGTFRVLRRASASVRRRPKLGPRDADEYAEDLESDGEDFAVDDADFDEDTELDDGELDDTREVADYREMSPAYAGDDESDHDARRSGGPRYADTRAEEHRFAREPEPAGVGARAQSVRAWSRSEAPSEYDEPYGYEDAGYEADDDAAGYAPEPERYQPPRRDPLAGLDEAALRPVPRRSGRGGYDPDAAEMARAYRYSRRRRVTVFLLLAALVSGAAGYFLKPVAYAGAAFFGLLMISYLVYLRRQVRIENDIQQRRLARLHRARQIRPEYAYDRPEMSPYGAPIVPPVPVSQVPPPSGYRRGREIVDLEDDDPSFDDLDYYQPVVYRRASGQ